MFHLRWLILLVAGLSLASDGVEVFSEKRYRGRSELLVGDDANLRDNHIGNDAISSIRVPPGFRAVLYEHKNFEGRSIEIDGNVPNLGRTSMGNNKVSSIRVIEAWRHQPERHAPNRRERQEPRERHTEVRRRDNDSQPGVILYSEGRYRGASERIYGDVADLKGSRLGNDAVCSLRVPAGWMVTLYEHKNFSGKWESFTSSDPNLRDNVIGNRRASSVRIQPLQTGRGVILYQHKNYGGRSLEIFDSIANLKGSQLGNDELTSLRIPPGYRVTLYSARDFKGRIESLDCDDPNLADNWIGNDRVSSIKVEWVGRH